MLLKEYYKRPDATAETINPEGWFMTGDAGFIDDDGHLKIIDRAKDVGKLQNGAMFAPNYIENKLKFFQHVKEAVCFGHDRDMVCAFINIDMGAVGNWAERRNIAYSGYTDLAGKPQVLELIRTPPSRRDAPPAGLARSAISAPPPSPRACRRTSPLAVGRVASCEPNFHISIIVELDGLSRTI